MRRRKQHPVPAAAGRLSGRYGRLIARIILVRSCGLRFDDKLATVLAQPRDTVATREAAWRQILDILAQRASATDPLSVQALAVLREMREAVPQAVRAASASALAGRPVSAAIVALVAEERPPVAAIMLGQVRLSDGEWLAMLPNFSPVARSLLRHRRDLTPAVLAGLRSFGSTDFVLPPAEVAKVVPEAVPAPMLESVAADPVPAKATPGESQIRDLLARIAAYRAGEPMAGVHPPKAARVDAFRFETGADGYIAWVEGAPRGPLIGASIAHAAMSLGYGVDGQAAGAYRHRAPFRDARLTLAEGSVLAGEWRIAGMPLFDPDDGRFTGYRGTARRPHAGERAESGEETGFDRSGLMDSGLHSDSVRQLVHELRTPLNAIVGFGEMIEGQVLGPAAAPYRSRAGSIVEQGRRLIGAVDDLDTAARLDVDRLEVRTGMIDPAALLERLAREYRAVAEARQLTFSVKIAGRTGPVAIDTATLERMFARMLAATIGLGRPGEAIAVNLERDEVTLRLRLSRPAVLAGRAEALLLDPGYSPDGDWPDAPMLGLGFALRLVRNLAVATGGSLMIEADDFVLRLPVQAVDAGLRADAAPL